MKTFLTLTDTAKCLGMSLQEASREIGRAGLETVQFQGRKCYLRADILDWLTREFGSLTADRLALAEQSNAETAGIDSKALLMTEMLSGNILLPERVGTRSSMLRLMASEACGTGALYDESALLEQIILREEAASTALRCGAALVHPLDVRKLFVEHSLLMLFRPPHPLPFGEETGRLTSLFFLLVFPSANEHLHMLARLNRMLRLPGFVDDLLSAGGPAEMHDIVKERERELREPLRKGDSR